MPDTVQIKEILRKDDPLLQDAEQLFGAMYEFMAGNGLKIQLPPEGARKWIENISKGLGRFGVLYVATLNGITAGFAHGSIRLAPDYLGNVKVGVITHIFVREESRGKGTGEKLVRALEAWFREKEVHSVELQVLVNNERGIAFWERLGYPPELLQCRKPGSKPE